MGKSYDKSCKCCPNTNIKFNFKFKFKSIQAASEMKKAIFNAKGQLIWKGHFRDFKSIIKTMKFL